MIFQNIFQSSHSVFLTTSKAFQIFESLLKFTQIYRLNFLEPLETIKGFLKYFISLLIPKVYFNSEPCVKKKKFSQVCRSFERLNRSALKNSTFVLKLLKN